MIIRSKAPLRLGLAGGGTDADYVTDPYTGVQSVKFGFDTSYGNQFILFYYAYMTNGIMYGDEIEPMRPYDTAGRRRDS